MEARPEVAARTVTDGHQIENHTWSHPDLRPLTGSQIDDQIVRTDAAIAAATGVATALMRPPYGSYDLGVRYSTRKAVALWDVDTRDWEHRDAARTVRAVLDQVEDGSVVLMHDAFATAADVAALLVVELRSAGYDLVTMAELLGEPEPRRVYYSAGDSTDPPPLRTRRRRVGYDAAT